MTMSRLDRFAVRFLVTAAAVTCTLVAWVSLAQQAHMEPLNVAPVLAPAPVDAVEVVDVTVSASGRVRGRR